MARGKKVAAPSAEIPAILSGTKKLIAIDDVTPHPKNARRGNVPAIKDSIRLNGFYGDVFVWKETMQIIVGSHRWQAARELGMPKIPAVLLDLTEAQAAKILAVDNRTSDLAGFDDQRLADLLRHITETEGTLSGTGYVDEDLESLLKHLEPKKAPEFKNLEPGGMQLLRTCPKCSFQF